MYQVLIADDEPSVIESLEESLDWGALGLELAGSVGSGREAWEFCRREKVDIVILDIRMPGLNGLELCEKLRKESEEIQLIIISGYAEFSYSETDFISVQRLSSSSRFMTCGRYIIRILPQ